MAIFYGPAMLAMSLFAFILYGIDKRRAQRSQWRISEATLLSVAALLGGPGAFLGMRAFRHKTQHMRFVIAVPVCAVIQIGLLVFLLLQ